MVGGPVAPAATGTASDASASTLGSVLVPGGASGKDVGDDRLPEPASLVVADADAGVFRRSTLVVLVHPEDQDSAVDVGQRETSPHSFLRAPPLVP
jgi:hypothetical protein